MKFALLQLDNFTYTKPFVKVYGNDDWIQWDTCDLEGLPVDRVGISIPKGQWDNLPETFVSVDGDIYTIEDICELKSSQ